MLVLTGVHPLIKGGCSGVVGFSLFREGSSKFLRGSSIVFLESREVFIGTRSGPKNLTERGVLDNIKLQRRECRRVILL